MLASLLYRVRSAEDLRHVFAHLGYTPDESEPGDGCTALARWKAFRIVGSDAADPRDAARAMAKRLGATVQPGLVAVCGSGVVALAAPGLGAAASSRVLAVDCARPSALALQLLGELRPRPGASVLAHALRIAEVLATEAIGERFFGTFRLLADRARDATPRRLREPDRVLLGLLPLTRVLFLYFVQAKGWLDGRPDYLRARLDDALAAGRHFHRSVLQGLCFGVLNRPHASRPTGRRYGDVPYLNGGLFEPHPLERDHGALVLPNGFWRDAFDLLFERFRFTVRENEDVDAVAPDMLGRVFERIMGAEERKRSGSFYTPDRIVRQVVIATLASALDRPAIPHDAWCAILGARPAPDVARREALTALAAVRLLDPAAGSGAFLLGALQILTDARVALAGEDAGSAGLVRRDVLRTQLFGVDLNPVAVRLAELRLWLAIIADESDGPGRVRPLPNLNGVVRQGDSLLDPLSAARALGVRPGTPRRSPVPELRAALYDARGAARASALDRLRAAELSTARAAIGATRTALHEAAAEIVRAARGRDLFGARAGIGARDRRHYDALRRRQREFARLERGVARGELPFFSFDVHAPETMRDGGFTAVVGNPPWVRAERLPQTTRAALRHRFGWWRGAGIGGYRHEPDLAIAFLERALELTRAGGAVGFLVPSKLTSAGYGETARRHLVRETTVTYVHRLATRDAAPFRAAVYPLALVVRKQRVGPGHEVRLGFGDRPSVPQRRLDGGPWTLVGDRAYRALARLRRAGQPLERLARPRLGVKTGADGVLVVTPVSMTDTACVVRADGTEIPVERSALRPAVRGRDVTPLAVLARRFVFWPYDARGRPLEELPPQAAGWMRAHERRLRARADYRTGPFWTLFRTAGGFAPNRVVWSDLASRCAAVALDVVAPECVPLNTCYLVSAPTEADALAVAATLNSTWIRALVHTTADEARGGFRRHNARIMSGVPVPASASAVAALAPLSRRAHHQHDIDQQDLDRAVARALGLPQAVCADLTDLARDQG